MMEQVVYVLICDWCGKSSPHSEYIDYHHTNWEAYPGFGTGIASPLYYFCSQEHKDFWLLKFYPKRSTTILK